MKLSDDFVLNELEIIQSNLDDGYTAYAQGRLDTLVKILQLKETNIKEEI